MKRTEKTLRAIWGTLTSTALIVGSGLPAFGAIVTDPTPDQAGSTTSVSISGSPLREGAVLTAGATATVGTSALLNPGIGSREIRTSYDAATVYQSGSVQAPEGWTLQYSIDNGANWVNTEPTPASAVTDIRATKDGVAAGAIDGYSQEYSTETVSSIPASTFSASTGGDGWGVSFYDNYVFAIYHHLNTLELDCLNRSTGNRCGSMTGATRITDSGRNFYAGDRTGIEVDADNGLLYVFTAPTSGTDAGKAGFLCVDAKSFPPTSCGFTALTDGTVSAYQHVNSIARSGTKVFGLARTSTPQLVCFDFSSQAACGKKSVNGGTFTNVARLKEISGKIFAKTDTRLECFEPSTLEVCGGQWPKTINEGTDYYHSDYDVVEVVSGDGQNIGVCTKSSCYDFSGASQSWTNPYSLSNARDYPIYSTGVTTLSRWYNAFRDPSSGLSDIECFDFSTNAACTGFDFTARGLMYELTVDPENPACLWFNAHAGDIRNVDAYTGGLGCASNPVITLQPSQFAPRYACSTSNGINSWKLLTVSNLVDGSNNPGPTATSVSLTVRDSLGNIVSGWNGKPVTVGSGLDMSALDASVSSSRPTFSFAFNGVTGSLAKATIALEYKGKGPELCSTVVMATPTEATDITVNGYLIDSVSPAGTYQSQRNFSIDPAAQSSSAYQTVPNEPTNLTGTGLNTSATITFTPPTDNGGLELTGYQYSLDGGSSWLPMSGDVDNGNGTRSFGLTGLTAGSTYQIKVAATNVLGRGTASSALSLTAQLVNLATLGDSYLSVGTINLVTQNENSLPYTYTAEPSSVCTVSGTTLTLVAVGTCSVTQDQAGDANNLATTASKNFSVLADPVTLTVPGAPQSLTAVPASTQVTLSWSAPASDGGATVSDYIVQYKVGTSWVPFTDGVNTLTSVVITGLTNGTSYDFKVAAVNSVGQGLFTTAVTSTPATIAGAATNLAGSKTNPSTTASLTWTAPASNGGTAITDYRVSYKLTSDPTWTLFDDGVSASSSATITGLEENSDYDYQVEVLNAAGTSAAVSTVTLVATEGDSQVGLTWTAPNTGGATILNYIVEYREAGDTSWLTFDTQGTTTSATLSSLTNGQAYDVRVAAMVSDGGSGQVASSYTSTVRATPFSAPAAPALVAQPGVSQLTISWTAPSANGATITDYIIEYKLNADSSWTVLSDGTSALTFAVITNLTNGSLYDVRAKAVNVAGQSAYSEIAQATPRTVPGLITGLTLTAGNGSLEVTWTAPTSDGGAAITDYRIQYKLLSATSWTTFQRTASTATEATVTNLLGLTSYSVRVAAVNPAGVGSFGAASSEVTLEKLEPVVTPTTPSTPSEPPSNEVQLDIKPVKPGQKPLDNAVKVSAGGNLEIKGANLSLVTKVMVGDTETGFKNTGTTIEIIMPAKLSLMAYETKIMTSDGTVTDGPVVDVTEVTAEIGGQDALLRRLPNGEIKVWVFDPLQTGKIQYFLKGREIAWVRPDEDDPYAKLRVQADTGIPYLVRTLRISENEIADFELHLDGVRVEVFSIEGRQS